MHILLLAMSISLGVPKVDVVEINTYQSGRSSFTQVILWRYHRINFIDPPDHYVAQWEFIRSYHHVARRGLGHEVVWYTDKGVRRKVVASSVRTTGPTSVDPEIQDRHRLPESDRRPYEL